MFDDRDHDDGAPADWAAQAADELSLLSARDIATGILDALTPLITAWGDDAAARLDSAHPSDRWRLVEAIVSEFPDPIISFRREAQ